MFKILGLYNHNRAEDKSRNIDALLYADDPVIIDCRKEESNALTRIYKRDYVHIKHLSNKGITKVFLMNEKSGFKRLKPYYNKCKDFNRELAVICESEEHLKVVLEKVDQYMEGK